MAKVGRPSSDFVQLKAGIRRSDFEDLQLYYPSFGARSRVIRALVARHVRKLNEKAGRMQAPSDECEIEVNLAEGNSNG